MKKIKLLCIPLAAVVIWAAMGITTSRSITHFSADQKVLDELPYLYDFLFPGDSEELFYESPQALINRTPLVIVGTFTGERQYQNDCFLSYIHVDQVIKGDESFIGKTIGYYETVFYERFRVKNWETLNHEEWNIIKNSYGFTTEEDPQNLTHDSLWLSNTMLCSDQTYLLFLEPINWPEEMGHQEVPLFLPDKSPYAKLSLTMDIKPDDYVIPEKYLRLKDTREYEFLSRNSSLYQTFYKTKHDILEQLSLDK